MALATPTSPISRDTLRADGFDWLLESAFFCQFDLDAQNLLLARMTWRTHGRDNVVVEYGERHHGMDLIVEGQAEVVLPVSAQPSGTSLRSHTPRDRVLARLMPGHVYGERSALLDEPANAQVRALSPLLTLHLDPAAFAEVVGDLPDLKIWLNDLIELRDRAELLSDLLLRHPFLRLLGRDDIQRFMEAGKIVRLRTGQSVVRAGDITSDVYVVVRGRVGVYTGEGRNRQLTVTKGAGWLFGHAAVLFDAPRTADVDALEPTELLQVSDRALMSIIHRNPALYRQLYLELAATGVTAKKGTVPKDGQLVAVYGTTAGLGTTTLAYGVAGALSEFGRVEVVDLSLHGTADSTLKLPLRAEHVCGVACDVLVTPEARPWPFRVVRPTDLERLPALLTALQSAVGPSGFVVVASHARSRTDQRAMEMAEAVVFVRTSKEGTHEEAATRHQYRVDAIRLQGGVLSLESSQRAVRIPDDPLAVRRFGVRADIRELLGDTPLGRAAKRVARALLGRSVGVALGGGGALGFAHIGLLRQLHRRNIPVDYAAGVSFGSVVAGVYAARGMAGLEQLVEERKQLIPPLLLGFLSTAPFAWWIDRKFGKIDMSATEIPFFPVGVDVSTGREVVRAVGTVGDGVRASSCLPGAYPSLKLGGQRIVDGGVYNNVPASIAWQAGAHFIIASNIIPEFPFGSAPLGGTARLAQLTLGRVDDLMRSLFLLMSQSGRDRAQLADYVFDLKLTGHNVYDFAVGDRIAQAAEEQVAPVLDEIEKAWKQHGFGLHGSLDDASAVPAVPAAAAKPEAATAAPGGHASRVRSGKPRAASPKAGPRLTADEREVLAASLGAEDAEPAVSPRKPARPTGAQRTRE